MGMCFSLMRTFSFSRRAISSLFASSTLMNSTDASARSFPLITGGTRKTLKEYLVLLRVDDGNPPRNFSNVLPNSLSRPGCQFLRGLLLFGWD